MVEDCYGIFDFFSVCVSQLIVLASLWCFALKLLVILSINFFLIVEYPNISSEHYYTALVAITMIL